MGKELISQARYRLWRSWTAIRERHGRLRHFPCKNESCQRGIHRSNGYEQRYPTGRWINLSPFDVDEFGVPRAYVQLTTTPSEDALANAMDAAILALANQLAGNNPANLQITSQDRDGLGTTYNPTLIASVLDLCQVRQTSVTGLFASRYSMPRALV